MQPTRAKLQAMATRTVITFTDSDTRRETYILGGWNLADDDLLHPPEVDPMSSAQTLGSLLAYQVRVHEHRKKPLASSAKNFTNREN